jgi:hypothetical protein
MVKYLDLFGLEMPVEAGKPQRMKNVHDPLPKLSALGGFG